MDKFKEIRPIVLGIARKDNKILVGEGYDKIKKQTFYRCLGGGIEFLETSQEALKREYKEELGIDVNVENYLRTSRKYIHISRKKCTWNSFILQCKNKWKWL